MGSNLAEGDNNLQHAFLWRGSKAICPIRFYGMLKNPSKYEKRYFARPNSQFHFPVPPALLLDDPPGRIARELW
jgi:hypothetical protein